MESIYFDHQERVIKRIEKIAFTIQGKGLYLIRISARTKNEKQVSGTDDEDLRIEIDNRKFSDIDVLGDHDF